MTRIFYSLVLFLLVFGTYGCRMCGSPYDYSVPAYINRPDDYRGHDPLYRAGSVLYEGRGQIIDTSMNTGNYGRITSITGSKGSGGGGPTPISKPGQPPTLKSEQIEYHPPSMQELLQDSGATLDESFVPPNENPIDPFPPIPTKHSIPTLSPTPNPIPSSIPIPIAPPVTRQPAIPKKAPQPMETMPFDAIPAMPLPQNGGPDITLEELRRLDPTVTDFRILNVDDQLNTTVPNDVFPVK